MTDSIRPPRHKLSQPAGRPTGNASRPDASSNKLTAPAAPAADETTQHATSFGDLHPERKVVTMVGVLLAMLLASLDQTIVGTALPRVVRDLGGLDHITWVVTGYMLASTVTVPIYGKLSDMYGRKWFFFSGIVLFLMGSMLCGVSHNMVQLIVFRALQGIGGGAIMGNAFAIIADLFEPKERAKWQGIMGGVFGLSSVIGPALGGWLTDHTSWRWVFFINLPLGLVALGFIGFLMPKVVPAVRDKVIDFWGAGLLVASLVPILLALSWGGRQYAWDSTTIIGLLSFGFATLAGFVWAEHKAKQPIIPLNLFKNSIFTTSVIITFLTSAAMFGAILYIPLFAQMVQGVSATNSGTILTPLMIGMIFASILSGQVIARTGKYKAVALAGGAALTTSLYWLSHIAPDTTHTMLLLHMVALGASLGLTMPVFNIAVQNAFEASKIGVVTASTQLFRSVGGTVGTAILGAVFNNALAQKAAGLSNTAYAQAASAHGTNVTDPNIMQGLLSPEGQAAVQKSFAALPKAFQASTAQTFTEFLSQAKVVYTAAVGHIFLISAVVASVAFVVTFALKEIPLQNRGGRGMKRAGEELAVEMGQAEDKDEPVLH